MKFEVKEDVPIDPEVYQKYLDTIYDEEYSFNCLFKKDDKLVALARGHKTADGFGFQMVRAIGDEKNTFKLENLKNCQVIVKSRIKDIVLKTFTLDHLEKSVTVDGLFVKGTVF